MNGTISSKILAATTAFGLVFASASIASAQTNTPGHEMQQKGSKKGEPGASGYSPGHEMQKKGSKAGEPGASGDAPGHH